MKRIKNNHKADDNAVSVRNYNTASLTRLADAMRILTNKDYRKIYRIAKAYRKADKMYSKIEDAQNLVGKLQTLSRKEFNESFNLADTLRFSDKQLEKAQKLEGKMKRQRFEMAQLNA